jgi:predicted transcriptional regulator
LVKTFFNGSASAAVAALLSNRKLSRAEYERLSKLLEETCEEEERES